MTAAGIIHELGSLVLYTYPIQPNLHKNKQVGRERNEDAELGVQEKQAKMVLDFLNLQENQAKKKQTWKGIIIKVIIIEVITIITIVINNNNNKNTDLQ